MKLKTKANTKASQGFNGLLWWCSIVARPFYFKVMNRITVSQIHSHNTRSNFHFSITEDSNELVTLYKTNISQHITKRKYSYKLNVLGGFFLHTDCNPSPA